MAEVRQFYLVYPIRDTVRLDSNWTQYRHIMREENEKALMNVGDNPPIGIILCADKSDAIVKYTPPENNKQIFAAKYQLYLPSEEELRREVTAEIRRLQETK
jgi:hypothetical protein